MALCNQNLGVLYELKNDVKKAPTFIDKVKYILNPPGWSHDGSTKIAKVMQQELRDTENLKDSETAPSVKEQLKQA